MVDSLQKLSEFIQGNNQKSAQKFAGTKKFWQKSLSGILLYKGIEKALKKFARGGAVLDAGAGKLTFGLNYLCAKVDIFLDKVTQNSKIFPLNYLMVVEKQS